MNNDTYRLPRQDVLKAVAMIMVVYAHCLQYLGIGDYLHHPLFKAIYAFHMPLFMTVSGYFAPSTLQKEWRTLVGRKAIRLLLPCVTAAVTTVVLNRMTGYPGDQGWKEFVGNLWYLKSLFLCLCIAKCGMMVCRDRTRYAIPLTLLLSLPFYLWHVNFMLPFFWLGYIWRVYEGWLERYSRLLCLASLLVLVILWPVWDGRHTTYITPFQIVDLHPFHWTGMVNLYSYILRLSIGVATSLCVISVIYSYGNTICKIRCFRVVGKHTLEYYTLHSLFIHTGLLQRFAIHYLPGWYECGYCLVISLSLLVFCECIRRLISRFYWFSLLWFGIVPAGKLESHS